MSESNVSLSYGKAARSRGEDVWGEVTVPVIEHEDRLAKDAATEIWSDIYKMFQAKSEETRREVRLAVYCYYAVNGASRRTKHSRDINTGSGISVLSSDVGSLIGFERLRQFLRSDVDDAYCALKETKALEHDEVFVSKAMQKGVPRGFMHCAVDFLRGCSLMTNEENSYADRHFSYSIERARTARGGLTVDEEDERKRGRDLSSRGEVNRVVNSDDF